MDTENVEGENKTLYVQHMPISGRIDGVYRAGEPHYLHVCMEPARPFLPTCVAFRTSHNDYRFALINFSDICSRNCISAAMTNARYIYTLQFQLQVGCRIANQKYFW